MRDKTICKCLRHAEFCYRISKLNAHTICQNRCSNVNYSGQLPEPNERLMHRERRRCRGAAAAASRPKDKQTGRYHTVRNCRMTASRTDIKGTESWSSRWANLRCIYHKRFSFDYLYRKQNGIRVQYALWKFCRW